MENIKFKRYRGINIIIWDFGKAKRYMIAYEHIPSVVLYQFYQVKRHIDKALKKRARP
jgi:hypothetical protein